MSEQNLPLIAVWMEKIKELLDKTRNLLTKIGIDVSDMPQKIFEENKPVSLVFAGQYSAGKSTIIKALTGIECITTGEGITTQEAQTYDWNDVKVIDTPGIHTALRPDHDEISYKAIADADMLVYVITHELFDDYIGQNFRKLLFDKDKAGETILIVNKMADIGNTAENQETKSKDLEKVTVPYTPKELRTVFIDAESYLDSLHEEDVEIAEELRIRSNYDVLIQTLNAFVRDKGISSQITTVLYRLLDFLQKVLEDYQPSTGDSDIDTLEEHLLQERQIILNTQWRIESTAKSIFEKAASKIREEGRKIANTIYDYKLEDEANDAIEAAYNKVNIITSACVDDVTHRIEELSQDYQTQLDEFYKSDFSQNLKFRLENKNDRGNPLIEQLFKSDVLAQSGKIIVTNTAGINTAANGLKAFSGSNVHQLVLDIGHFFGHNFKPWEAVKWVKGINVAGKMLGVFGVVLSFGIQVKEDIDSYKREKEMKKSRENLRAGFNDAASAVVDHFNNALGNFLSKNYLPRIADIDSQIKEIKNMRTDKSEICRLLEDAQSDCQLLISNIHLNNITAK